MSTAWTGSDRAPPIVHVADLYSVALCRARLERDVATAGPISAATCRKCIRLYGELAELGMAIVRNPSVWPILIRVLRLDGRIP